MNAAKRGELAAAVILTGIFGGIMAVLAASGRISWFWPPSVSIVVFFGILINA